MNDPRAKAARILARIKKADYNEALEVFQPRGAGTRLYEGAGKGAATGGIAGLIAGAGLGGLNAYQKSQGKVDNKELIKAILLGALEGGAIGGVGGAGIGAGVGGLGDLAVGSRKRYAE